MIHLLIAFVLQILSVNNFTAICKLVNLKRAKCMYHMLMSKIAWFIIAVLLAVLIKWQESQIFFSNRWRVNVGLRQ